jgi:hypothetical protein
MHAGLRSARSKSTGSSGELDDARSSQVKSHVSARIGTRFARVLSGGELFYWLAPLIVVLELVGSVFDAPVPATLCFLALFVGALWLAPDVFAPGEAERRWPRRVLGVLALLAGASAFSFGVLRFASPENLPKLELPRWLSSAEWRILLPVAGAYALSLTPSLLRGKRLGPRDHERMGILIALAFIVMLDSRIRVQSLLVLPYQTPTGGIVLRIAGGLLLLLLVVPRLSTGVRLLVLIVAALAVRVVGLGAWELDPVTRDMLPLAKSAQDGFIRGENPYAIYQMQRGSEVPLTYLPGMWLIHGIPRLFGADLRFLGVAVDAIVAGSLWWAAGAVSPRFIERARGFVIGFSAVWLFSPSVHWNGIYAEPHAWWGVLAILLAAVMRRSWWIAAAALGVALATRQFAAVVAPFVLIALIKDLGFKQALPRIAVTGTLAALLLVPFVAWDADMFFFGTLRWLLEYGPVHESWFWGKLGFSGTLYRIDATEWMPRAQLGAVLVMAVLAPFVKGARAFIAPAGTAYVLFVMFNGIIWDSFYLGCALFAAFACAAGYEPRALEARVVPVRSPAYALSVGLLASSVAAFVGLAVALFRAFDDSGRKDVQARLVGSQRARDAVLDRSDRRLAFVKGRWLVEPRERVARFGYDPFERSFGALGVLGSERLWLVSRTDRDDALFGALERFSEPFMLESFGRYRVLGVSVPAVATRLSALESPDAPRARRCDASGVAGEWHVVQARAGESRTLTFHEVLLRDSLALLGAIEDRSIAWGRPPVHVALFVDGRRTATLRLENRHGVRFEAADTRRLEGKHALDLVISSKDPRPRGVCIETLALGGAPALR